MFSLEQLIGAFIGISIGMLITSTAWFDRMIRTLQKEIVEALKDPK
jgi:ABC-type nitrate/sulfonate/bicarbonate transport system permease component